MAKPDPILTLPIVRRGDPEEAFNVGMNEWVQKMPTTIDGMNESIDYVNEVIAASTDSVDKGFYNTNPTLVTIYDYVKYDRAGTIETYKLKSSTTSPYQINSVAILDPLNDANLQPFNDVTLQFVTSNSILHDTLLGAKSRTDLVVGSRIEISDRGNGEFVVITGGASNPWNILQHDTLPLQLELVTNNVFLPVEWGVDTTGAVASDAAFEAVSLAADAEKEPLTCSGDVILLNVDRSFPDFGITGNHKILGATLEVSGRRNFKQLGGRGEYNQIKVSDSTYNRFSYAEMYFDEPRLGIIDIKGGGSGTFWNTFDSMLGDINLTVGDEDADNNTSINQNYFLNCRGYLHMKGGDAANTRPQEINQNWFQGIDTTGANLTAEDGSTGWHILNDSYLNQTNVIAQWYSEGSGKKAIRGNYHVLSSFVDGVQSPYALPPTNHVLLNPDNSVRNQSDYFAAAHVNEIEGGSWDILNAADKGQPKGFSYSSFTPTVISDSTEPSGLGFKFGGASAVDFSAIRFKLTNNLRGRYTVWFWMQSLSGSQSMQVDGGGSPASTGVDVFHDAGNGWRLYRISSPTRIDGADDFFTIFHRSADSEFYISTVWGTPFKTALLPYPSQPKDRVGVTDTGVASSIPIALPTGGRIINTDPNLEAPANIEWVKRSSGLIYLLLSIT